MAGAAAVCAASPAAAQIEEVVVTSQKRANAVSVQDVPTAITAVNEATIIATQSVDLTDIGRVAPNAILHPSATFTATPNFFIRGVGVSGTTRSLDPAVGVVLDGVYVGYIVGALIDVFDTESIEVLRGPQGTLFGRNVTGGAINVRSKRPTGEFDATAEIIAGNFNRLDASVSVEGPLIEDTLAAKVAIISRNRDGYWTDRNGGSVDLAVNPAGLPDTARGTKPDVDLLVVRPMLNFTPTDDIEFTLIGEYQKNQGGTANSRYFVNPTNPRLPTTVNGYIPPDDPFEINHDLIGGADLEVMSVTGELNWNVGPGLVTSITNYRDLRFDSTTDFDGTPFAIFHFPDNKEEQNQFTQELRFASQFADRVDYVIGANYFDQEYFIGERRAILGGDAAQVATIDHSAVSVFGEADVSVIEALRLTVGGRWTYEEKTAGFSILGTCALDFSSCAGEGANLARDGNWSDFTPKVALTYLFNDDVSAYASWTRGFRSGTFDARARTIDSFLNSSPRPETVDNYEIGLKSLFADQRVLFNAAVFYSEYEDIQRLALERVPVEVDPEGTIQRLINAAQATIWGVEAELSANVFDGFTLDASLGYTNAEYDEFDGFDADGIPGFDPITDPAAARALEFERVPEWNYFIAGTYEFPVQDLGDIAIRASWFWSDSYFNDALNTPEIQQESYGLLDATVTYTTPSENLSIALFGRNLNNNDYFDFALDNALTSLTWGGNWGVRLIYNYDQR